MKVLVEATSRRRRSWRRRLLWGFAALTLMAVGVGAAGLYAYDRSQRDRVAAGVVVHGIEIGGLSAADARATLSRRLLPRYRLPLVLVHGRRHFPLRPAAVGVRIDIAGAVARARHPSLRPLRKGHDLPARSGRNLVRMRAVRSVRLSRAPGTTTARSRAGV